MFDLSKCDGTLDVRIVQDEHKVSLITNIFFFFLNVTQLKKFFATH